MEGVVSNFVGAWVVEPYKGMCLEMAGNFDYMFVVAPVVGCNHVPCLYFDYHPFLFVSFALESLGLNHLNYLYSMVFGLDLILPYYWTHGCYPQNYFDGNNCHGAKNNKELVPWCRRGLLAYVYNGISE